MRLRELKKMFILVIIAIEFTSYCAEKKWNFNDIKEIKGSPLGKKDSSGFVQDGNQVQCKDGIFSYEHKTHRCFFNLQFDDKVLDASKYNLLHIRIYTSLPGKLQLYYLAPNREMAAMDSAIEIATGWNEYIIDLSNQSFGKNYHSRNCKDNNYKHWGGSAQKISGLRLDSWFPKGTNVKFDYICLLDSVNDSIIKQPEKNRICNSSFEEATNPGVPDHWGTYHWGVQEELPCAEFEKWRTQWTFDEKEKYDGKRSFKIISHLKRPQKCHYLTSCQITTEKGPHTFSVYLKGDKADSKVVLEIMNGWGGRLKSKVLTISDKWKRYSITENLKTNLAMVSLHPLGKGTIWIDAAQLEKGEKATDYKKSFLDDSVNTVPIRFTQINKAPRFDGTLDDPVWKKAERFHLKQNYGSDDVAEPTDVYLLGDNENLYIGVKCIQPLIKSFHNKVKKLDQQLWRDNDSVQIFISPNNSALPYYQLIIDWQGNRFDSRSANPDWDGLWQVKAVRRNNFWTAEVVIPWSILKNNESNSDTWRFNVCRENRAGRENTSLFPVYGMFHTPRRFGYLAGIPSRIMDAVKLDILEIKLIPICPNQYDVVFKLQNRQAVKRTLKAVVAVSNSNEHQEILKTVEIEIMPRITQDFKVGTFTIGEADKYPKVAVKIFENKKLCTAITKNFYKQPAVQIKMKPDLSYYTREKKVIFSVKSPCELQKEIKAKLSIIAKNKEGLWSKIINLNNDMSIDIAALADGCYRVEAELIDKDGQVIATSCRPLLKLPPMGTESKLDLNRKCLLLNGKPLLLLAIHLEIPIEKLTGKILNSIKQLGFNSVSLQFRPSENPVQIKKTLDRIEQAGLKCLFAVWIKKADDKYLKNLESLINEFKQHPAIISWFTLDEPDGWQGEKFAEKAYKLNKKLDPYRPAFINYTPNKKFNMDLPTDIRGLDHYPVPDQDFKEIPFHVEQMARTGQPVWIALQTTGNAYFYFREPTPDEFNFMTYSSLINGASGFIYFAQLPHSKLLRDDMAVFFSFLKKYTPILLAEKWNNGNIEVKESIMLTTREYATKKYVLALNKTNQKQQVEFKLSNVTGIKYVIDLVDNRKIEIKNNMFLDSYKPFQYKIYKLEN